MKNSKKFFSLGLALVLSLGLIGCGTEQTTPSVSESGTVANEASNEAVTGVEVIELTSETINYDGPTGQEGGKNQLTATLAIDTEGTIQAVKLQQTAAEPKSKQFHTNFENAISANLVGQKLDSAAINKLGGASNTTAAFTKALEDIKTQYTANNA